jgi:rfaE bifunctional protein nucleotidyltransferase chain/domain
MSENKIKSKEKLIEIIRDLKGRGKKIAQCHGCFDLLHIGHIKHLRKAKELSDILVVTITPDRFIFKGPGRPVFNEQLRMEMLSNLECVNFICLNDQPSAETLIKQLKPDYYVKGYEYKDLDADLSGKIRLEQEAVEVGGGELLLTEEPTFSSTGLINRHLQILPPKVQRYFSNLRGLFDYDSIQAKLGEISKLKVLILGDSIIDEYCYCQVAGAVTKYPILSAILEKSEKMPGGSLAVVRHLANFVDKVHLVSVFGKDNPQNGIITDSLKIKNVTFDLFEVDQMPTILKKRYISKGYPNPLTNVYRGNLENVNSRLFEICQIPKEYISRQIEEKVIARLEQIIKDFDLMIIADFGHGFITPHIIKEISKLKSWLAVSPQTNSSNFGFNLANKYSKSDFVCIDELEARLLFGDRSSKIEDILKQLKSRLKSENIMVTRGKEGTLLFNQNYYWAPAFAVNIVDPVGAGDAVLSIAPCCVYQDFDPRLTVFLSGCFGALATKIVGNRMPINKHMLLKYVEGILK